MLLFFLLLCIVVCTFDCLKIWHWNCQWRGGKRRLELWHNVIQDTLKCFSSFFPAWILPRCYFPHFALPTSTFLPLTPIFPNENVQTWSSLPESLRHSRTGDLPGIFLTKNLNSFCFKPFFNPHWRTSKKGISLPLWVTKTTQKKNLCGSNTGSWRRPTAWGPFRSRLQTTWRGAKVKYMWGTPS
jgi:hypothetical protein